MAVSEEPKKSFSVEVWAAIIGAIGVALAAIITGAFTLIGGDSASNSTLIRSGGNITVGGNLNINSPDPNARRAADLAEEQIKMAKLREAEDRAASEKALAQLRSRALDQIRQAGFTPDAKGYALAMATDVLYMIPFGQLDIKTNEAAVREIFNDLRHSKRIAIAGSLPPLDYPWGRALMAELIEYQQSYFALALVKRSEATATVRTDYPSSLKTKLCDPSSYKYKPDTAKLAAACKAKDFGLQYYNFLATDGL